MYRENPHPATIRLFFKHLPTGRATTMKNLIIGGIVVGLLGYGGAKLYLHNEVSSAMDQAVMMATPFAKIEYDGVISSLTGELTVDGLTVRITDTPDVLWPPNGRLHHVTTEVEILEEEPDTAVTLVGVVSDEEDSNKNKKCPDIVIIDDYNFELRAERNGWEDGRTYTISYMVSTACGQEESFSTTVIVPHDQGNGTY